LKKANLGDVCNPNNEWPEETNMLAPLSFEDDYALDWNFLTAFESKF